MAAMVPMGIDFWASRRSPERLEPAMIPEQAIRKKIRSKGTRKRNLSHVSRQNGPRGGKIKPLTRHRGEVDADQQRKEAGDVRQHVAVCVGQRVVLLFHRSQVIFGNQVPLLIVCPKQVLWKEGRKQGGRERKVSVACGQSQTQNNHLSPDYCPVYTFLHSNLNISVSYWSNLGSTVGFTLNAAPWIWVQCFTS